MTLLTVILNWRTPDMTLRSVESALVALPPHQPAERLLDAQAHQPVVVGRFAEMGAPRLMEDIGPRPGHAVEHDQAQRTAGHVHAVAHRVGAQQA